MNKIAAIGITLIVLSAAGCMLPVFASIPNSASSSIQSISSAILSVSIALVIVNYYMLKRDKKFAAAPMLRMIEHDVSDLWNNMFLRPLHLEFGQEAANEKLQNYTSSNGRPESFSSSDRLSIYKIAKSRRNDISDRLGEIDRLFQELSLLMGWSYDARIVRSIIQARMAFRDFSRRTWDDSEQDQLDAVETYLDACLQASSVHHALAHHMGLNKSEYLTPNFSEVK